MSPFKNDVLSSRSKLVWHAGMGGAFLCTFVYLLIKHTEQVMISFWYVAMNSSMLIRAGIYKIMNKWCLKAIKDGN